MSATHYDQPQRLRFSSGDHAAQVRPELSECGGRPQTRAEHLPVQGSDRAVFDGDVYRPLNFHSVEPFGVFSPAVSEHISSPQATEAIMENAHEASPAGVWSAVGKIMSGRFRVEAHIERYEIRLISVRDGKITHVDDLDFPNFWINDRDRPGEVVDCHGQHWPVSDLSGHNDAFKQESCPDRNSVSPTTRKRSATTNGSDQRQGIYS